MPAPTTCPHCGATLLLTVPLCRHCGYLDPRTNQASAIAHHALPIQPLRSPTASWCALLFTIIWTLFSLATLGLLVSRYLRDSMVYTQLAQQGTTTTAIITDLRTASRPGTQPNLVSYSFHAEINGSIIPIDGSAPVDEALFGQLAIGQPIEIIYLPTQPWHSAIENGLQQPTLTTQVWLIGLSSLATILGSGMVIRSLSNIRSFYARSAANNGLTRTGE
ncbi:MAG: DUF3592 domain-containing protein [Chloroflexus sp.]